MSKAPAGWDEGTQGCYPGGGESRMLYWQKSCVGYSLQKDASRQVTLEQATAITGAAFAGWHDVSCGGGGPPSITGVDMGPVACGEVRYNKFNANQNVIVFRDTVWPHSDPGNTLGLTTVSYDPATGEIIGADMEINSTLPIGVRAASGLEGSGRSAPAAAYDLATIMVHEVGHFLGLAHSAVAGSVMDAHYKEGAQMAGDDIAGICAAYPSDGRRPTSAGTIAGGACDPTPRHGFSSECAGPANDPPQEESSSGGGCTVATPRVPRDSARWSLSAMGLVFGFALRRRGRRQ